MTTTSARAQKRRPTASCKPKPRTTKSDARAGDSILLGWRLEERAPRMGFTEFAPEAPESGAPIWLEGEGHLITMAPTGRGKGRGALIPNLLTYEGQAIVIDPKGEAYRVTARRRRELGQKVYVIDPFGLVTDKTDSLNPFDGFDIAGVDPSATAMEIAKHLSGSCMSLKEPFWDIRGHDLAAGVISAVSSTAEPDQRNLNKARKYLKSDDVVYNLAVVLDTVGGKLHRYAYEEISSFLQTEDRCRSGILATACSYFSIIGSDAAQRTVMSSTIDMEAFTRGDPMTIYMVVPPDKLQSHAALFKLWTSMLMTAAMARKRAPKYRTLFAIDECGQLGDFGLLPMIYTLARAYGVRVWAFFQDFSQVKRMLPEEWPTVLTNSAVIQTFGVPNHLMAADLAPVLGDFSEDTLRRMPLDNVALQVAGERGFIARRPDYLRDEMHDGLFDANPMAMPRV